jgi:hypothetical protein
VVERIFLVFSEGKNRFNIGIHCSFFVKCFSVQKQMKETGEVIIPENERRMENMY